MCTPTNHEAIKEKSGRWQTNPSGSLYHSDSTHCHSNQDAKKSKVRLKWAKSNPVPPLRQPWHTWWVKAILPMDRARGGKIQSGITLQGQAKFNHCFTYLIIYPVIHTNDDLQNVFTATQWDRAEGGPREAWTMGLTTDKQDEWKWDQWNECHCKTLFWDKTLPVDAVDQQYSTQSALGERRTFMIGPIKATLNGYMQFYILCLDAQKGMCIYIHIREKGWNTVLLTTWLPRSTSPSSPSPWPFLPTRVNPSLRILTSSVQIIWIQPPCGCLLSSFSILLPLFSLSFPIVPH